MQEFRELIMLNLLLTLILSVFLRLNERVTFVCLLALNLALFCNAHGYLGEPHGTQMQFYFEILSKPSGTLVGLMFTSFYTVGVSLLLYVVFLNELAFFSCKIRDKIGKNRA